MWESGEYAHRTATSIGAADILSWTGVDRRWQRTPGPAPTGRRPRGQGRPCGSTWEQPGVEQIHRLARDLQGNVRDRCDVVFNWSNLHRFPLTKPNSFADILNTPAVTGANLTSQGSCQPKSGRVEVCNARYGYTGWLGLAQVWTSGGHIVQGTAKINDTYLDSSRYTTVAKQDVLCQEVGHTFGLGHTSEDGRDDNTCMDYADGLDNPHTNAHDNQQINAIYATHDDPAGTATSTTTAYKGRGQVRRLRRDVYSETFPNGDKVFTFVTFVDDAAAARAPRDRVPE